MKWWLAFCFSLPALAANDVLVWGQMQRTGFTFVGKPEAIREQCLAFTSLRRVRTLSSMIVRGELVQFERLTYAAQACERLLISAVDLGSPQKHKTVVGDVRRYPFTFTGLTTTLVARCMLFLQGNQIPSASEIHVFGETIRLSGVLRGSEICGEIAMRGREIASPFAQSYAAGSIDRLGYVFVGYKEIFIDQCLQFVRDNRLTRATVYEVDEESFSFPSPVAAAPLCEAIYQRSRLITDSQARFSASGRIRNRYFWFVGTVNTFLTACQTWMTQNFRGRITEIDVDGARLNFSHALEAQGSCGLILKQAKTLDANFDVVVAVGRLGSRGFAFAGTDETFDSSCRRYLNLHRVGRVNLVRVGDKDVRLPDLVEGGALCRAIQREGEVLKPPYRTYTASGDLAGVGYCFRGRAEEVIEQCQRSLENRSSHAFGDFRISGKNVSLSPQRIGGEICGDILAQAPVEAEAGLAFVGGAIGRVGFSFAGPRETAIQQCVDFFRANGIGAATQVRIFDRPTPVPGLTGQALCQAIFNQGAVYQEFPKLSLSGTLAGRSFEFSGSLERVNDTCKAWVREGQLEDVASFDLGPETVTAPLESWQRDEVCSAIIRKGLK